MTRIFFSNLRHLSPSQMIPVTAILAPGVAAVDYVTTRQPLGETLHMKWDCSKPLDGITVVLLTNKCITSSVKRLKSLVTGP